MASHRGAAALLLIASLLAAVALTGAHARPTVRPDKTAALRGADARLTPRTDAHGPGYVAGAAAPAVAKPECDDDDDDGGDNGDDDEPVVHHHHVHHHYHHGDDENEDPGHHHVPGEGTEFQGPPGEDPEDPQPSETVLETESEEPKQELCSTCEPEPKPEPTCNTCEQEPKMTCNKVHAVQEGETCDSVGRCAGLGHDDFLRFNPNICCDHLFVGQWICLEATCA